MVLARRLCSRDALGYLFHCVFCHHFLFGMFFALLEEWDCISFIFVYTVLCM